MPPSFFNYPPLYIHLEKASKIPPLVGPPSASSKTAASNQFWYAILSLQDQAYLREYDSTQRAPYPPGNLSVVFSDPLHQRRWNFFLMFSGLPFLFRREPSLVASRTLLALTERFHRSFFAQR